MSIAPLMFDLDGIELSAEEKDLLQHPLAGGVILFSRNYESVKQLELLINSIRKTVKKPFLISVDHEGGRVQRFKEEFTRLPEIAKISEHTNAESLSYHHAWLMASEIRAMGIDFSFAPVLDVNYGISEVIGDRSFHHNPEMVTTLGVKYIQGMREAGMASTGKHFPGHGGVSEDSHHQIPVDKRTWEEIWENDVVPFVGLINKGLDAVMPAHVIYSEVDDKPAGFSSYWLQRILRDKLKFDGVIFSDDLTMQGASVMGGYPERAEAAVEAGCDMILVCNNRKGTIEVIDKSNLKIQKESGQRLLRMQGKPFMNRSALLDTDRWHDAVGEITKIV